MGISFCLVIGLVLSPHVSMSLGQVLFHTYNLASVGYFQHANIVITNTMSNTQSCHDYTYNYTLIAA